MFFFLWPLYSLSFLNLRLLITILVIIFSLVLSVLPWLTTSGYPIGIFKLLTIVLSVLPRFTASDYSFGTFKHLASVLSVLLRFTLLITTLWYSNIWSLYCLSFDSRLMNIPLVSSNIWPLHFCSSIYDKWSISGQAEMKSSTSVRTGVYRIVMMAIPLSYLFILNIVVIPLNWR